jgi:sterol desaturase/sphingolipid hydroxylase (fatty acid hydroxylase superfamily)
VNVIAVLSVLAFAAGWFAWTLGEYCMHRFGMHALKGKGMPSKEHLRHHADRDSVLEKWPVSWTGIITVGVVVFFGGGSLVLARPVAAALAAGWVFGYGFYDLHHYRAHRKPIANRYERWLRRHHFHHHFGHPMANHGVTLPLWDHVFGTYEEPGVVRVPERMAMIWLLGDDGDIKPEHAADYVLARGRRLTDDQAAEDRRRANANLAPVV